MRSSIKVLLLVTASSALAACGPGVFDSRKGLVTGLAGKTWRSVVHLEPDSTSGVSVAADGRTHLSFDAVSAGNRLVLAATLYDANASTPVYRLYARAYWEELGLAESGVSSSFVDLASAAEAGQSLGAVGAIGNAQATSATLTTFQTTELVDAQRAVCRFTRSDWGDPTFSNNAAVVTVPADLRMQSGPLVSMTLDRIGQFYTAYVETAGNDLMVDQQALGGSPVNLFTVGSEFSAGVPDRLVSLAFDGRRYVCALWQDLVNATTVNYRCYDALLESTGAATALSTGSEGRGHAIAGKDGYMAAAYFAEDSSGTMQVYVNVTDDGTFADEAVAVSDGMASGYDVLGDLEEGGAPQVIAVDSGYFMVAWTAASASQGAVYYSLYDLANESWSTPEILGEAISYFSETPVDSFHLFTDGHGGAGVAIRYLSEIGATRDLSTRKMLLSRYELAVGWLALEQKGEGCTPAVATEVAGCSHRPVGAILDSGAAVVLFQEQDSDGFYRWAGVEFR
jgi:hypothetical protein